MDRFTLYVQIVISWIFMPIWYFGSVFYMHCLRRYSIKNIQQIRQQYQKIHSDSDLPLLICANHLTKIDSLLMQWAFGSFCQYFTHFKTFAWNLPEHRRFKNNLFLRLVCYLGCCIPINRGGSRKRLGRAMEKVRYLLRNRHAVMIFPEGKRSVIGRIDKNEFTYGVGALIQSVEKCRVLGVYLRGEGQTAQSNFPKKNEQFYLKMQLLSINTEEKGLRANRELATQVVEQLVAMEDEYFSNRS